MASEKRTDNAEASDRPHTDQHRRHDWFVEVVCNPCSRFAANSNKRFEKKISEGRKAFNISSKLKD